MSFIHKKYPLLLLHLASNNSDDGPISLDPIENLHCFIYGPLIKQTLAHVKRFISTNNKRKIFWKVTSGNYQDCQEFDELFAKDNILLFFEEPIEVMAMECARHSSSLDFRHYFFASSDYLRDFSQKISTLYVLDYYYLAEKKTFKEIAAHIVSNLNDHHDWHHLKGAKDAFLDHPLILMGAGSSLDDHITFLRSQVSFVPKMALGSALGICHDEGIKCDFGVISCPSHEAFIRLGGKINPKVLFTQPRTHSLLLKSSKGKKVMLNQTSSFGFKELNALLGDCPISNHLPMGSTTVASLGLMIAIYLGFSPIITCGIDLKYLNKAYAGSITSSLSESRFKPEIIALETIACTHPNRIFRLGSGQLFNNIQELNEQEVFKLICSDKSQDLELLCDVFQSYECDFSSYLEKLKDQEFANSEIGNF